ncbi:MAG TPA: hypothetical protein VN256_16065 [Pyrinomonadaceae bacterium]|nr:hypothetical protein [Pyrinomonadaceae bacterium]
MTKKEPLMKVHNVCNGKIECIVGFEGCYDDNYGRCLKCGVEGELITVGIDMAKDIVLVLIKPIKSRHDLLGENSSNEA